MYTQNNKIHRLRSGMLAIMLLLSTSAMAEAVQDQYASDIQPRNMAEEILGQGESALAQMTLVQHRANDWHHKAQDALASHTQKQASEPLIATLPDCTEDEKKSPLANRQSPSNVSEHLKQAKG